MKLVVIGFGQCGGNIADEFKHLDNKARLRRRIKIISDVFAVNTDTTDLESLRHIKSDYHHRILIGNRQTGGHGVGKINEVAARLASEDGDKIIDAVRSAKDLYEADAFLLITGAAGGTGSGSMPITARMIKKRFHDKPIYTLIALPFEHEEQTDARTYHNTATCLKAAYSVSKAVFLFDNQRYIEKDSSLLNNMKAINELIAEPFYDLLCAGEVKKAKNVGTRLLDGGDIISTLEGLTIVGYGVSQLPIIKIPFERRHNFKNKSTETQKGISAMEQALSNLSVECNPLDSASALYLLSAPTKEMNMNLVKELSRYLSDTAPEAIVRYGDYPRGESTLKITVILSQLSSLYKVKQYYDKMPSYMQKTELLQKKSDSKLKELIGASACVPSLFSMSDNED
ncbi:tubulin/FtsZ family protein [Chloroflexota bacterium]